MAGRFPRAPSLTVLVVEDDEVYRGAVRMLLARDGIDVIEAGTAARALEAVAETSPDAVVTDWRLPDMTGVDLCRVLKTRADTRHLPVVMFTGLDDHRDRTVARHAGADGYLVKSADLSDLIAIVRTLAARAIAAH